MLHLKQTKLDKTKKRVSINIETLLRCRACQTLTNSALNQISNIRSTFGANIPFPKVGLEILNINVLLRDCYDHVINNGETFFRGNYLKLVRSRIPSIKQFQVIQREVLLPPDEINEMYINS